jgi:putative DNA primase/helicase
MSLSIAVEAEHTALGAQLAGELGLVDAWPEPDDYQITGHAEIATAIEACMQDGEVNSWAVAERLEALGRLDACGGMDYLVKLSGSLGSTGQIKRHAAIVRENGERRRSADGRPVLRKLQYVMAADLPDADETFDDELVEGVLGRGSMAVIYGDSNSGKTFLGVELGASISQTQDWLGKRTAGGLVVYLATEAAASVVLRLQAYQRHHSVRVPGFVIVKSPINLFDGDADTTAILALIDQVERKLGGKVSLIIGDTLSRMSAGANENSGEDMGVVLKHADAIRAATGATFLWIHHCGKDQARGMRGWSGMRAAIDTEIEVTSDDALGVRAAEITKQRDLPGKGDRIGFRLLPVAMGVNRWGTPRSSCVVEATDAPAKAMRGKRTSELAGAIVEFLTTRGAGCVKGALAKHFDGRFVRQSVYREVGKLLEAGLLIESAGVVALPGRPGVIA